MRRTLLLCVILAACFAADAADVCPALRQQPSSGDVATRIADTACTENQLWYRPFIDADGRVASTTVAEAESSRLADGVTPVWQRVAMYWRDSGLLGRMSGFPGAAECGSPQPDRPTAASCRAFIIDTPWSAAFVSYVMAKAGVPGFRASASHFDYVRDAGLRPQDGPFQYMDPATTQPSTGDLLCYVRMPATTFGYAGLKAFLQRAAPGSLNMHCDIVVAANPGGDGKAYLIGGNIQQGVTMRLLHLNRNGLLWALPQRTGADASCSPDDVAACNFNRQDWAVLLKLKPPDALAQLQPQGAMQEPAGTPSRPLACCVNCVVGADPPVPRCPNPPRP